MEGYDAKFDPPLEKRLECPICLLAQKDPLQTPCGHRFCGTCIVRAINETAPRCPVDNQKCTLNQLFPDNYAKREVLSLTVKCNGDTEGCTWRGELRYLKGHIRECEHAVAPCPNGCDFSGHHKAVVDHLIICPNKLKPCTYCRVLFSKDKAQVHKPNCSHYTPSNEEIGIFQKRKELLKWCGKMTWTVKGSVREMFGCLTQPDDDEELYHFCTAHWNGTLSLIPLLEEHSKVFFSIINLKQQSRAHMFYHPTEKDFASHQFENSIRCSVSAFVCPVAHNTPVPGPNWIILTWNSSKRRISVNLVEIRGYVLKQLLSKLKERQTRQTRHIGSSSHHHRHHLPIVHQAARLQVPRPTRPPIANRILPYSYAPVTLETLDPNLPLPLQSTLPPFCTLPAGSAAPGGSFFTFPSTPSQFFPSHWHPLGPVPQCCIFKQITTPGQGSLPPNPYTLPNPITVPPVTLTSQIPQDIPGPSSSSVIQHIQQPQHSVELGHIANSSRQVRQNQSTNEDQPSSSTNTRYITREMSPSRSLLHALRGIRLLSGSSSNSNSPLLSPISSSSSYSANQSVGSPSSEEWSSGSEASNSPINDYHEEPQADRVQRSDSSQAARGMSLEEIQRQMRRSRSGNFYLSSNNIPSPLDALANASTLLENRPHINQIPEGEPWMNESHHTHGTLPVLSGQLEEQLPAVHPHQFAVIDAVPEIQSSYIGMAPQPSHPLALPHNGTYISPWPQTTTSEFYRQYNN